MERRNEHGFQEIGAYTLVCTGCNYPTFLQFDIGIHLPSPKIHASVEHLPESLGMLFRETGKVISSGLYNTTVLLCRKLLMNLTVQEGARENQKFPFYVDFI
ncbi:hypothetical protein [Pseudalkalibacillus sp. SCS-8]|uniref:hypothetical protein n=1 Tax=Pseudalkalibacillus nanhaiensis TaxID=3115291 RepID=UPI0032DADB87